MGISIEMLEEVKKNGMALSVMLKPLMNKKIVLAAVYQNGMALQYAPEELQNDKEVVMAAVRQNGFAL
jgi:hypothetical protein